MIAQFRKVQRDAQDARKRLALHASQQVIELPQVEVSERFDPPDDKAALFLEPGKKPDALQADRERH
ncbi:hypothetical protein GCM10027093_62320 [Paraburkholderia jirisanensis]